MHFYINTSELNAGISAVARALAQKSVIPILEGIYIRAEDGFVTLICTDLSLRIEARIPATITAEGAVVMPGRLFSEIVRRLPGEETEFIAENLSVQVKSGRSKTTLQANSAADYPMAAMLGDAEKISIRGDLFKDMIRQTAFAVSTEENKPSINGVLLKTEPDNVLKLVSIDGFRLAIRRELTQGPCTPLELVIPGKALSEIGRIIEDDDSVVELALTKTHITLDLGHTKVLSRLLDVKFIDYQSIMTTACKTRVRINRSEMLDIVERASLIAREGRANVIKLNFEDDTLTVTAKSEIGSINEQQTVEIIGDGLSIAFNARYILDILKNIDDDEFFVDMTNNVSQCIFKPIEGEKYYFVVVPMRTFD